MSNEVHKPEVTHVIDQILSGLRHMNPSEARDLASGLTELERAELALFCYSRNHLRNAGRAIAGGCSEHALVRVGGMAGRMLFRNRNEMDEQASVTVAAAKRISLAGCTATARKAARAFGGESTLFAAASA